MRVCDYHAYHNRRILDHPSPLEVRSLLEEGLECDGWVLELHFCWPAYDRCSYHGSIFVEVKPHIIILEFLTGQKQYRIFPRTMSDLVTQVWRQLQAWWQQYLERIPT